MYRLKLIFRGVCFSISIKSLSIDEYDLQLRVNQTITNSTFETIRKYLENEGFVEEAQKYSRNNL